LLQRKEYEALWAIREIARKCIEKEEFDEIDLNNLLICFPALLERRKLIRIFLRWLGKMASHPQVLKEAGVWGWALKKFSQVIEKW